MRITLLTILLTILTLTTSAQEITTNNLLPNAGDGVDWNSSSTDQINPGSSGTVSNGDTVNGFTVTCPTGQSNCGYKWGVGGDFEATGTATLSVNDIALTNNDRTQEMLDNGITLNSYIDVANCDHEAGNCEGDTGNTDSHTVVIELKDSSGIVLSTTTQTRTDIDGFQGNCNGYPTSNSGGQTADCGQYNDQVIYNNHGSNKVDWSWTGTDNNTGSGIRGGPNLLGAKLTMTYDDTVLNQDASDSLDQVQDDLGDLDEQVFDDVQEFFFQEEYFTFDEEPQFEMEIPMTMEMETFAEEFVEEFFMEMDQEFFMEEEGMEFEDGPMLLFTDDEMMEEVYEESNEIIATFLPMVSEEEKFSSEESFVTEDGPIFMEPAEDTEDFSTETFQEEEMIEDKSTMMSETFEEKEMVEDEPKEMAEEETIEEETMNEKPTKIVEKSNEEKIKEEKPTSETSKKSTVSSKKITKQKKVQSGTSKTANVKSQSRLINLEKVMEKVDKDIKDISKNLQIKNIIKLDVMASDQVSLESYNVPFYKSKDIYFDQLQIQDLRQVYADANLNKYIANDPVVIMQNKLNKINIKKQRILIELEQLKNG